MAEVTILTPNNVGKRHQQQQQDVLMMSSLSDDFARQLSSSSSPLVAVDGRMADNNDDHQHFEDEPTLQSPSASGAQHLDVIISAGGHQQSDDTGMAQQRHSPADKSCHYSDGEDDDEDDDEEEEEEHEEEQDALVRASRLSRRHSSAGAVPMSLTVSPSNVFTDVYQGGTSVTGRGLVRERSAPTRRCRIEEEQPRNQSATSSARPAAGAINNNVAGNWLNVPGAADSSGKKKNKTASSGRNNVSIERLELVPAAGPMRNKSPSGALGSLAAPGRRLQQNNSFGGTASELLHHRPSNPSLESSAGQTSTNKESLRHHRPSSTSQHHHVRSQSVRVAPRSTTTTTTSNRNNNISSSINQPKLLADYNSVQQHQQSIKVRPRGTSLPGTNRFDPASATTAINAEEQQQQQQQHYYGINQQTVGGEGDEADYYLLRHFIVHGKSNKVVNRGDSFRRSLRSHKQQQQQSGGAISQHSSTSSIRYT